MLATNPVALSGVAGIMAQAAAREAMAEITEYLMSIDEKADDVLRKAGNSVVAQMVGVGVAIDRAMTIRDEVDVLELDRRMAQTPEKLDAYRLGMRVARQKQRGLVSAHTRQLLDRMAVAVDTANRKMVWTRDKSMAVIQSSNHLAGGVHDFHELAGLRPILGRGRQGSWDLS